MGDEHDEVMSSFLGVTGATDAQGRFFLESANWELDAALIAFFEAADDGVGGGGSPLKAPPNDEAEDEEISLPAATVAPNVAALTQSQVLEGWAIGGRAMPGQGRFPRRSQQTTKENKKGSSSRGGITTLSDLGRHADTDEDSDEEPQEYYTGGEKR